MHILCKKRLFWSFGLHFKGSCRQLNAFVIRFFWNPPPSVTARTYLPVMAKWITVQLLLRLCSPAVWVCLFLASARVCVCVCLTKGDLCHCWAFTSWQVGAWWVKITQRFPILSSFGNAASVCFDCACVPQECSGSPMATSCHMVPSLWCPPPSLNIFIHTHTNRTPGKERLVTLLNRTPGGPA